jgi:hypothetical protein
MLTKGSVREACSLLLLGKTQQTDENSRSAHLLPNR